MRTKFLGLLGVALLAGALAAHAAPITYSFTVNAGSSGPLAGQTATGSMTFDSSIIPAGGGNVSATGLLTGLSFTWEGVSYNASTANTGWMDFTSSGGFVDAMFGPNCAAGTCGVTGSTNQWDINLWGDFSGLFMYAVPGYPQNIFNGTVTQAYSAPEPDTIALFALGLGALLFFTRRRRIAIRVRRQPPGSRWG